MPHSVSVQLQLGMMRHKRPFSLQRKKSLQQYNVEIGEISKAHQE